MDYKDILNCKYFFDTYNMIEELKKDFPVNHGFLHINNVLNNGKYLADIFSLTKNEKELLLIACVLHDIGYLKGRDDHAKNGAILAKEFLKDKLNSNNIEIIANAISCHGGKNDIDYKNKISLCLILSDKFDFDKTRYRDDEKYNSIQLFKTIEKVKLEKQNGELYLNIYTTDMSKFQNLEENYFFIKLLEVLNKVKKIHNLEIKMNFVKIKEINNIQEK